MDYQQIYELHLQLLQIYETTGPAPSPYQNQIQHFKNQMKHAEDMVQQIFVLNQIIKIHEQARETCVDWCSDTYFSHSLKNG
jgi:hypothetical protein